MTQSWNTYQKASFRLAFLFFLLQVIPLEWKYWLHVFTIGWGDLQLSDIFYISRYTPQWTGSYNPAVWGLASFADWGISFVLALTGALIWTFAEKKPVHNYNRLFELIRILVRYRLAIGLIAYGFIKLYPLQAPLPSISHLNTAYGDLPAWKLFALSLGIVPGYESFLGAVELTAGIFLLFRKTATIGASIVIFFTGNVFMSNLAYEGGEVVYSFYLVTLALFVVSYDLNRIIRLIILRKPVQPAVHTPVATSPLWRYVTLSLKTIVILFFVVLYGAKAYNAYAHGGYQYPSTPGLKGWAGVYNVSKFEVNGKALPYALNDSIRWKNVVFEKWATLSIGKLDRNATVTVNTEEISSDDAERHFESDGVTGRQFYRYTADTAQQTLVLQDRTVLHYNRLNDSLIRLYGVLNGRDTIYAELQRINKKYLLKEAKVGRRQPLKL